MKKTYNSYLLFFLAFFLFSFKEFNKAKDENVKKNKTETKIKLPLEKKKLNFGFIKLTDMAPLAIAKNLGFFSDEGLEVTLVSQANWTELLKNVIEGQLDGAHMLVSQPLAAAVNWGQQGELITPFCMDLNGNGITVSKSLWERCKDSLPFEYGKPIHPISGTFLNAEIQRAKVNGKRITFGVVASNSTHNYQLRYWLAEAGINPGMYGFDNLNGLKGTLGGDIDLKVIAPPKMPSELKMNNIEGYCVGEPWNQQSVFDGTGVPVITSRDIYKNHAEKTFAFTKDFADRHPNTVIAVTKALIRAGKWLDNPENRMDAVRILSKEAYVDAEKKVIDNSMLGTFEYEKGDVRNAVDFNVFFRYHATYPFYSDGIWYLTQMRRWGQINESKPDKWYHEKVKQIYKPEIWLAAAKMLLSEGLIAKQDIPVTDGYKKPSNEFLDKITFDGKKPTEYLKNFKIGNND